jgi:hypothetical protein
MFSRSITLSAALALALAAGGAFAQSTQAPRTTGTPTFSSYDANRDGRITRPEASTNVELINEFERIDLDNDEGLDAGEFARFEAEMERGRAPPIESEDSPVRPFPAPTTSPPPKKP